MIFKGPHKNSPTIRKDGARVKAVPQMKYFGVQIHRKLNFSAHVNCVSDKAKSLAVKFMSVAVTRWGLRSPAASTIYKRAVAPTATYVLSVWAHRLRESVVLVPSTTEHNVQPFSPPNMCLPNVPDEPVAGSSGLHQSRRVQAILVSVLSY